VTELLSRLCARFVRISNVSDEILAYVYLSETCQLCSHMNQTVCIMQATKLLYLFGCIAHMTRTSSLCPLRQLTINFRPGFNMMGF